MVGQHSQECFHHSLLKAKGIEFLQLRAKDQFAIYGLAGLERPIEGQIKAFPFN